MKNFLTLIFITLPIILLGQSWVNVVVQTDDYGGETSWEIYQDTDLMAVSPAYGSNSYNEVIVDLPVGEYTFIIYDSFGDGICCGFGEGYFGLKNICNLDTFVYDFDGPQMTVYFDLLACPPPVFGCMDTEALNFNPWANVPSSCTFPPAPCDIGATNIIILVSPDSYPAETSWDITANGEVVSEGDNYSIPDVVVPTYVCVSEGDTLVANIYDSYGDGLCGTCWGGIDGFFNVTTLCGDSIFSVGGVQEFDTISSGEYIVPSCIPFIPQGCTNSEYVEYDSNAIINDGSCETLVQLGCIDETMFNYDSLANTMDVHPSCDYSLIITDGGADGWFGSWLGVTQGSNIYGPYQMGPDDGYEEEFILNLTSDEEVNVYFFTSGNAATTAAQCGFKLEGPNGVVMQSGTNPWTDPLKKFPYVYSEYPTCLNYCVEILAACTDPEAQNFTMGANTEDGSCYYAAGCMQAGYLEYCIQGYEADFDDGSCNTLAVFGCTEELALNYNPEANVDIDNCIEVVIDCMDPTAENYNELANTPNNELCLYDAGCIGDPGDPYYLNDSCYAWIINIDSYCCEVEWDNACVTLYDYCQQGWPTGVPQVNDGFSIYPNPVNSVLNVQTSLDVFTEVYNTFGQIVIVGTREKRIDLIELPNGFYHVVVNYNGRIINKKIIKI
jgi:hypothetical protein